MDHKVPQVLKDPQGLKARKARKDLQVGLVVQGRQVDQADQVDQVLQVLQVQQVLVEL
jgi:hypothetical protein